MKVIFFILALAASFSGHTQELRWTLVSTPQYTGRVYEGSSVMANFDGITVFAKVVSWRKEKITLRIGERLVRFDPRSLHYPIDSELEYEDSFFSYTDSSSEKHFVRLLATYSNGIARTIDQFDGREHLLWPSVLKQAKLIEKFIKVRDTNFYGRTMVSDGEHYVLHYLKESGRDYTYMVHRSKILFQKKCVSDRSICVGDGIEYRFAGEKNYAKVQVIYEDDTIEIPHPYVPAALRFPLLAVRRVK